MKKITMCAVALAAVSGFASIESANVVGYLNKQNTPGTMKLVTPCFSATSGSKQIKLSEISIGGYKDSSGYKKGWYINNGISKAAVIAVLNNNGGTKRQKVGDSTYNVEYFWYDTKTMAAGWYDANGKPMTEDGGSLWGSADNIVFKDGNGFRLMFYEFYAEDDPEEEGDPLELNILFNGQVMAGDPEVTFPPGLMKASGNLMPAAKNLSQFSVSGYMDASGNYKKGWYIDNGISKAAVIAILNNNGGTKRVNVGGTDYNVEYFWFDTKVKAAGWYDTNGKPMTEGGGSLWGDAANIVFNASDGFRVMINEFYAEDDPEEEGDPLELTLNFPGCL